MGEGPLCQVNNSVEIDQGTSCRSATPPPGPQGTNYVPAGKGISHGKGASFELSDAPRLCIPVPLGGVSEDEARVAAWIWQYRQDIIDAEARFRVDRRAIAGAIAWEALENVLGRSLRAEGPGKIHVFAHVLQGLFSSGDGTDTLPKLVEDDGYLPQGSIGQR